MLNPVISLCCLYFLLQIIHGTPNNMRLNIFCLSLVLAVSSASLEFSIGNSSNLTDSLYKRDGFNSQLFSTFSSVLNNQYVNRERMDSWIKNLSNSASVVGGKHGNNTSSFVKRSWRFEDWFRFSARMVGYTGATFSGFVPFCRSFVQGDNFFTETWQCVVLTISMITIVDSVSGSVANELILLWSIQNKGVQNRIGPSKRDIVVETYGDSKFSYMPCYNISGLTEYYNSIGLAVCYLVTDSAVENYNGIFAGDLNYTLCLGSQQIANIVHANNVTTISINGIAHTQRSIMKRDIGEESVHDYFKRGDTKLQYYEYHGYSERLSAPNDIQVVYDAVNCIPGFWYYDQQQIIHIIGGDMNAWVDMAEDEDYQKSDTDLFDCNDLLEPPQVSIIAHDEL